MGFYCLTILLISKKAEDNSDKAEQCKNSMDGSELYFKEPAQDFVFSANI
jgi:hypothetical protein